jgi:predicted NAD-dependent protein-ADP-ribosyltransferase YbiA (DUF1768 family)
VEQAYQLEKAVVCDDKLKRLALVNADDPYKCKSLGSKVKVNSVWMGCRVACMEQLLEQKAKNPVYREALTSNIIGVFVEDTVSGFWGRGRDYCGRNTLGCLHILTRCKILMGRL